VLRCVLQWELGTQEDLLVLNLSQNELVTVPDTVGLLTTLRSLDLCCNMLDALPPSAYCVPR
jgi:hypothetical protein